MYLKKLLITLSLLSTVYSPPALAQSEVNFLDELNPQDPQIESVLQKLDEAYQAETGISPFLPFSWVAPTCRKFDCPVYALVNKSTQTLQLYIKGSLVATWLVSTGAKGSETPDFEGQPDGRIYDAYTSKANPGGDYKGLGNMPYAVFIYKGYAIHGTLEANFKKLGTPASHGCVRLHSDNAKIFNRLVREYGAQQTWVSVVK